MNRIQKLLTLTAGTGLLALGAVEFTGLFQPFPIRGEASLIVLVAVGLIALFVHDYSRRPARLQPLAPVVRPARPRRTSPSGLVTRRAAAIVEHAA